MEDRKVMGGKRGRRQMGVAIKGQEESFGVGTEFNTHTHM